MLSTTESGTVRVCALVINFCIDGMLLYQSYIVIDCAVSRDSIPINFVLRWLRLENALPSLLT